MRYTWQNIQAPFLLPSIVEAFIISSISGTSIFNTLNNSENEQLHSPKKDNEGYCKNFGNDDMCLINVNERGTIVNKVWEIQNYSFINHVVKKPINEVHELDWGVIMFHSLCVASYCVSF